MDFLDDIADLKPLPAGGAAAAYTANLGIALIHKVLLSEMSRKELDPAPQATLRIAQKEIEHLFLSLEEADQTRSAVLPAIFGSCRFRRGGTKQDSVPGRVDLFGGCDAKGVGWFGVGQTVEQDFQPEVVASFENCRGTSSRQHSRHGPRGTR